MRRLSVFFIVAVVTLAGCVAGPKEQLISKSALRPSHVDLSGRWHLRDVRGDTPGRTNGDEMGKAEFDEIVGGHDRSRKKRTKDGSLVRVFLEYGQQLKITQTDAGLFISFDRSVVEEYRFGEHRFANVGPIEAERVSGWEGERYVIETLDEDGAKLIETYALQDGDAVLIRHVAMEHKEQTHLVFEQTFDRVGMP